MAQNILKWLKNFDLAQVLAQKKFNPEETLVKFIFSL